MGDYHYSDDIVEDNQIAKNRDNLERAVERLAEKIASRTLVLLQLGHRGLLIAHNVVWVRIRILPHRLRVNEEDDEGDWHDQVVTSHVQK